MTAGQDQTAAGDKASTEGRKQAFRSPFAVAIWWLWVLFALGNLIDLAVQGRDHLSLVAAFVLLLVTGIVYTAAQRPRIVADDDGLTVANPLRDHRIGWAAVSAIDAGDLVRVRCEWPDGKRTIYAWAVHSSRRRQLASQLRAESRKSRPRRMMGGFGGFAAQAEYDSAAAARRAPGEADQVVTALSARAEQARSATPPPQPVPPVSSWRWQPIAAIVVPALALVIAILA
ncbi:MAG TPA: PH domain-containing protein [Trebonia sp.]